MFTEPWVMPPTAGAMKIKRGVVYNPTIHHGYLLEKNLYPGHRQPWPLPPPIGHPRPFCSRVRVDVGGGDGIGGGSGGSCGGVGGGGARAVVAQQRIRQSNEINNKSLMRVTLFVHR
jgi:hypothetical protein